MENNNPNASNPLQFDKAIYEGNSIGTSACAVCHSPLQGSYTLKVDKL